VLESVRVLGAWRRIVGALLVALGGEVLANLQLVASTPGFASVSDFTVGPFDLGDRQKYIQDFTK